MIWFSKINSQALKDWFIAFGSGAKISPGRSLDPFGSSMRKFNNAHAWMREIKNTGNLNLLTQRATDQAKTDLRSVHILDPNNIQLSQLGDLTYNDWQLFVIPELDAGYEIHRCFLLLKNAIILGDSQYNNYLNYWRELRTLFSFNHLISTPEHLYFFSFFNRPNNGFNPYEAIKGLKMNDIDFPSSIDWNIIIGYYNDPNLTTAANNYEKTINGIVARQGRTNFCIAMELFLFPQNANAIINALQLLDPQKELLIQIAYQNSNLYQMESNKIYFGAPGTGKSQKINQYATDLNSIRVTFHPDTDYSSFVGSYKPTQGGMPGQITYKFVPQQFLQAYLKAWETTERVYLIIEEINRGNCAQIFGDIFQLIERKADKYSTYPIDTDTDLSRFLETHFNDLIAAGGPSAAKAQRYITNPLVNSFKKMVLPDNLYIHATMNTSDQSLFPIDSAFKRRWDWEYVPIEFDNTEANDYLIRIGTENFSWRSFIEAINMKIEIVSESEDKKLGQFFIKSYDNSISEKMFQTKVMFYLWNDILKDEQKSDERFFFKGKVNPTDTEETAFSFTELFSAKGSSILRNFMTYLNIVPVP